jgi:hypothetical protein
VCEKGKILRNTKEIIKQKMLICPMEMRFKLHSQALQVLSEHF